MALTITAAIVIYKARYARPAAAPIALNALPQAHAFIKSTVTPKVAEGEVPCAAWLTTNNPLVLLFLLITTAAALYKLFKLVDMIRFRCRFGRKLWKCVSPPTLNQKTSLFIKISSVTQVFMVHLTDIAFDDPLPNECLR